MESFTDFDETPTIIEQREAQQLIDEALKRNNLELYREQHISYLMRGLLQGFPASYTSLDSSKPWLIYWILHGLSLLGAEALIQAPNLRPRILATLASCQTGLGGPFGGGPGQMAHLAPTYAAVSSIAIMGGADAYGMLDRETIGDFLRSMRQEDGSFRMHLGGEVDLRASYCAIAVAALLGIDLGIEESSSFISQCQTYEGGLGAVPFAEAHAGYTYCGFAALAIATDFDADRMNLDLTDLSRFAQQNQCPLSGGFRGRTNKLVDGCYSFWTGALFPLLRRSLSDSAAASADDGNSTHDFYDCSFQPDNLQSYILACCQNSKSGGLRDKPGKHEDYYHTCYCLSGLSVAQHYNGGTIVGGPSNRLEPVDPAFNLVVGKREAIQKHFQNII